MKNLLIYFILTLGLSAQAQQNLRTSDAQQHTSASTLRNYVKNSGAEKSPLTGLTDTNSIATRTTSNVISGAASFLLDATTSGHFVGWQLDALQDDMEGNAVAEFDFKGDGSLYKAYVYNTSDSTVVSAEQQLSNASTTAKNYILFVANPAKAYELRIAATDNAAAAFRVDNVTVRKATAQDVATIAQPESILSASRITSPQTIGSTSETTVVFNSETFDTQNSYNTSTGVFTSAKAQNLVITASIGFASVTANEAISIRVKRGSTEVCRIAARNNSTDFNAAIPSCPVSVEGGETVSVTVQSSADTSYDVGTGRTFLSIQSFPPSSTVIRTQAPGADWTSFTPTGSWTTSTTYTGQYRCMGDTLMVQGKVTTSGTPTSGLLTVNLPSGFTIDASKLVVTSVSSEAAALPHSTCTLGDSGTAANGCMTAYNNTTSVKFNAWLANSTYTVSGGSTAVAHNIPFAWTNNDSIGFSYIVPVTADSPCPAPTAQWVKQGVIGAYEGTLRFIGVRVGSPGSPCAASPCTMADAYGVSSVTRATTGDYTINFSESFVGNPICNATAAYHPVLSDRTSSSIRLRTNYPTNFTGGQANTDSFFEVTCFGPAN